MYITNLDAVQTYNPISYKAYLYDIMETIRECAIKYPFQSKIHTFSRISIAHL